MSLEPWSPGPTPWGGPELDDDLSGFDWQDDDGSDEGSGGWDDGFGRGWTAAQNAAPACCLHGEDCPRRRPVSGWRRLLAFLRGESR